MKSDSLWDRHRQLIIIEELATFANKWIDTGAQALLDVDTLSVWFENRD